VLLVNQVEGRTIEFTPAPVDVESIVRELVAEFQLNTGRQHTINVEYQGAVTNVLLDEKLVQSMLRNLLSNAINYSPKGSEVRLELIFQQDELVFRISDQGIGISPTDQAHIFNAFFRGNNVGTAPGVGLGLVIVKECVSLHDGTVVVDSELGRGTTFTITLPLQSQLESKEE
jgi:signal transduction histidine kinase